MEGFYQIREFEAFVNKEIPLLTFREQGLSYWRTLTGSCLWHMDGGIQGLPILVFACTHPLLV